MKVSGAATLHAPPGRVWAALRDPAVLARAIPGCERLEASGPRAYRVTVTTGIASTRGTYAGEVSLTGRREPTSFALEVTGAGSSGTVSATVQIRLADTGNSSTQLSYDADAEISGMIANVGQRMLSAIAQRLAGEFLASLDTLLTAEEEAPAQGPYAGAATQERRGAAGAPGHGGQASAAVPGFIRGVLIGTAGALGGVIVTRLVSRRNARRNR